MTTLTQGRLKGEHVVQLVDADRGDISLEKVTFATGNGVIKDGTVIKDNGSGKAVPALGTTDTAGDSDESILGTSFGQYDTTSGDVAGVRVARLAVVDTNLIVTQGTKAALVAALAKLFIIAR
jgi:hypothetical protein